MAGKFGESDPIFLPSMFLPFLPASSDCFQQANYDRNITDRKMLVYVRWQCRDAPSLEQLRQLQTQIDEYVQRLAGAAA